MYYFYYIEYNAFKYYYLLKFKDSLQLLILCIIH